MQRFVVEVPVAGGGVSVHQMKAWLRDHPGHLPKGMSATSSTSHQLRAALKKRGWKIRETADEVRLVMPEAVPLQIGGPAQPTELAQSVPPAPKAAKPWCWEGNVVCAVVAFLTEHGWTIVSTANTETGEPGVDIEARRHGQVLIVEVKGYPSTVYEKGPKAGQRKPTNPSTQARHWVAEALMTAVLRQAESKAHQVALAFPEFSVYQNLLGRIEGCLRKLGIQLLLVRKSGEVSVPIDTGVA